MLSKLMTSMDSLKISIDNIRGSIDNINNFLNYLANPRLIWDWFVATSYDLTCIIASMCLIYYVVTGSKKFSGLLGFVIVTYVFILGINYVL